MTITVASDAAFSTTQLELQATGSTGTVKVGLPLTVNLPASVLLVDDDQSNNNFDSSALSPSDGLFRNLLPGSADYYVIHEIDATSNYEDGPTFEHMRSYEKVVWYCGSIFPKACVSASDEARLAAFLDQGNRTLIIFSDVYPSQTGALSWAWNYIAGTWLTEYVGLKGLANDLGNGLTFSVDGGSVLAGISMVQAKDVPITTYAQGLNPAVGTDTLFSTQLDPDGSGVTSVAVTVGRRNVGAAGTSKVILFTFPFENLTDVASPNTKAVVFSRLMTY